ncbi:MAG: hypothetical protein V1494_03675 [Candidatus Diapherotrites archaeon]
MSVLPVNGFFIQYKFIIPESVKHSSYTYQKLFRAIYGYTQNVSKSNGKTYRYHRKGVLSDIPYIRPGKNCVIIPPSAFNKLVTFFKTGKNPTHAWEGKGDWKAVYYMDEKHLNEKEVVSALESLIDRTYVFTKSKVPRQVDSALSELVDVEADTRDPLRQSMLTEAEKILNTSWFKESSLKSERLSSFYASYKKISSQGKK